MASRAAACCHLWRRLGGSHKEIWFECLACGECRKKLLTIGYLMLPAAAFTAAERRSS